MSKIAIISGKNSHFSGDKIYFTRKYVLEGDEAAFYWLIYQ